MEFVHFLVFHLGPAILVLAGFHMFVLFFLYIQKKKKSNQKIHVKNTKKIQILQNSKTSKRRHKKLQM